MPGVDQLEELRRSREIGQDAKVYSVRRGGMRDDDETAIQRGTQYGEEASFSNCNAD